MGFTEGTQLALCVNDAMEHRGRVVWVWRCWEDLGGADATAESCQADGVERKDASNGPKSTQMFKSPEFHLLSFFFHLKNIYVFGCIWVLAAACGLSSCGERAQ